MKDLFDLTGRNAVITGGGGLLGFQHADALLQKNCNVDLWDINEDSLKAKSKLLKQKFPMRRISMSLVDITNEFQISELIKRNGYHETKVDILINNAALNPKFEVSLTNANFENYPINIWNNEIAVGLTGSMLCSKHVGRLMATKGGGVILNIASDLSVIAPDQRIYEKQGLSTEKQFKKPISYSVIKSGLVGLTKYLSTYWALENIRVNALSPGGVYEQQDEEFVLRLTSLIPMGRMANKDEYSGAIQFLCSDASSYMTGQNIIIAGGR